MVQLYVHDKVASMMRPLRELKAFRKVLIKQQDALNVEFAIGYDKLGFYTEKGEYVVEKGSFDIYVGENCLTENKIQIEIQ